MLYRKLIFGAVLCSTKLLTLNDPIYVSQSSDSELKVFGGLSHKALAAEVAGHLGVQLGRVAISKFTDGETKIRVLDNVSGKDVYVIQSICSPVNDSLVELLFMIASLRIAHCRRIVAVVPYLAYTKRDEKQGEEDGILGADVVKMIESMGADVVISIDFHSPYVKGFFRIPAINLTALPLAARYFAGKQLNRPVILSLSFAGLIRAAAFHKDLLSLGVNCDIGVLPDTSQINDFELYHDVEILPADLKDRDIIITNNVVTTGASCCRAVHLLRQHDVGQIYMFATHGIFVKSAISDINKTSITELVVTNTLPIEQETIKIRQLSVGKLLAEAIRSANDHGVMISEYTKE